MNIANSCKLLAEPIEEIEAVEMGLPGFALASLLRRVSLIVESRIFRELWPRARPRVSVAVPEVMRFDIAFVP